MANCLELSYDSQKTYGRIALALLFVSSVPTVSQVPAGTSPSVQWFRLRTYGIGADTDTSGRDNGKRVCLRNMSDIVMPFLNGDRCTGSIRPFVYEPVPC